MPRPAPVPDRLAALLAVERGTAGGLTPRLPSLFEDPFAAPTAAPDEPATTRAARALPDPGPASPPPAPTAPPPSAPAAEAPVRVRTELRSEVTRVERGVMAAAPPPPPQRPAPAPVGEQPPPRAATVRPHGDPPPAPRAPSPPPEPVDEALRPATGSLPETAVAPVPPVRHDRAPVEPLATTRRRRDQVRLPEAAPEAPPTVHVTIGRLEIRAVQETLAPRPARERERRMVSLDDYLDRRNRSAGP